MSDTSAMALPRLAFSVGILGMALLGPAVTFGEERPHFTLKEPNDWCDKLSDIEEFMAMMEKDASKAYALFAQMSCGHWPAGTPLRVIKRVRGKDTIYECLRKIGQGECKWGLADGFIAGYRSKELQF